MKEFLISTKLKPKRIEHLQDQEVTLPELYFRCMHGFIPNLIKKSLTVSNLQLHLNEMLLLTNRHVMDKRIPFYVVSIERSPELPFWLCIIESEPEALHWINSDLKSDNLQYNTLVHRDE